MLIIDSDMVKTIPDSIKNIYKVPGTSIARQEIKVPITANIVMLGALCKVTGILERSAFEQAILETVPNGKEDVNMRAFELGFNMITKQ